MRLSVLIAFAVVLALFQPWKWLWNNLEGQFLSQQLSLAALQINVPRMTEDLVDVLADHPTLPRLQSRYYVAHALLSCDLPAMALYEEISDFSNAIELDPKYARAYYYRGIGLAHVYRGAQSFHLDENTQRQILDDLSTAIRLDPKGKQAAGAYDLLATEYECGLREHQKAIEICTLAISNLPVDGVRTAYYFRGWIYGKLGQHQNEIADTNMAKSLDSSVALSDRQSILVWQFNQIVWLLFVLAPLCCWKSLRWNCAPALAL